MYYNVSSDQVFLYSISYLCAILDQEINWIRQAYIDSYCRYVMLKTTRITLLYEC